MTKLCLCVRIRANKKGGITMIKQRTSNNRLKEVLSSTFVLNGGYLKKVGLDCYKEEEPNQNGQVFFTFKKELKNVKKD